MEQVSGFSRRFQLSAAVTSQAGELYRLADVKGMLGVRGVSSSGLALVCLEIAAGQHGETFDKKQAQKLSGLQPRAYTSTIHSVSKVLNLSTTVSLQELAIRFGCLEAEQLATETLHNYRGKMDAVYSEVQKESLDFTKPLYLAAALYTACKLLKIRSDKTRFHSVANCPSKAVFQTVLDQMTDCVPKKTDDRGSKTRKRKRGDKPTNDDEDTQNEQGQVAEGSTLDHMTHVGTKCRRESLLQSQLVSSPLSQDYLQWKERVLASARAKLASQK